ncbi:hypothetical protein MRB53_041900 [Persea americana]|nr:hypothetical protein MRB53_041900 [Persea americana]
MTIQLRTPPASMSVSLTNAQQCETFRAYFLGLVFMGGATALNTFFSPRQPAITLMPNVLQLLLAPCGLSGRAGFLTGIHFFTERDGTLRAHLLDIVFRGTTYYIYLVQRLPQYLNQGWVDFGYEICLALATQLLGIGFAGVLRRFVIYPATSIWPKVLPTLALNRALIVRSAKAKS